MTVTISEWAKANGKPRSRVLRAVKRMGLGRRTGKVYLIDVAEDTAPLSAELLRCEMTRPWCFATQPSRAVDTIDVDTGDHGVLPDGEVQA